jgi:hypothetical protein
MGYKAFNLFVIHVDNVTHYVSKLWPATGLFSSLQPYWSDTDRGKLMDTLRETYPSVTLSTTTEPGANCSLRGDRPASNRLSHGTTLSIHYLFPCSLFNDAFSVTQTT